MTHFVPGAEYGPPWKPFSLLCGIVLLLLGARCSGLPDWDLSISLVMAVPAHFTAPCCLRVLLERRWKQIPQALLRSWFCIGGTYTAYWYLVDPAALPDRSRLEARAPDETKRWAPNGIAEAHWSLRAVTGRARDIPSICASCVNNKGHRRSTRALVS